MEVELNTLLLPHPHQNYHNNQPPTGKAIVRLSLDKDVGSSAQHGHRGHDGECGVGHQTQSVQHHGSKFPVALHRP